MSLLIATLLNFKLENLEKLATQLYSWLIVLANFIV